MTGPEWMATLAALQVGLFAALRLLGPGARHASASRFWGIAACVVPLAALADLPGRDWWSEGAEAIAEAVVLILWWLGRRKGRKRAAKWLGAKSRALRDAIVRKARQAAQPRPVLAPGGAR